jgi:hypothetical protein
MKFDLQWNVRSGVGLVTDAEGCQLAVTSAATGETRMFSRATPKPAAEDAGATEQPPPAPPAPAQVLSELKPEIGKGRIRIATAVDSQEVFCKHLSLPSSNPAEIAEMLSLQIEKWSPLPMEEVVWSHEVLGTDANGADVLVVFGRKDRLIDRAAQFGEDFIPDLIDVDLMVLYRALRNRKVFEGKNHTALVAIDPGARAAKCMLLKGATPLLIEHPPVDLLDPSVLSRALSHFLLGAEASVGARQLDEIFLLVPDDIRASVSNELGLELRVPVTPLERTPDLTPAAGLSQRAARNGAAQVNLLPVDFVEKQQKRLFRQQARRVGLIVAAVYMVVLLIVAAAFGWKKFSIARIESRLASDNPGYQKALKLQAEVQFLQQKLVDPRSALETLRVVSEGMNEQLSLNHFGYKQGATLELRGVSQSAQEVFKFIDTLQKSGLFSQVRAGNIRSNPGRGSEVTYEISCTFGAGVPQPPAAAPARVTAAASGGTSP